MVFENNATAPMPFTSNINHPMIDEDANDDGGWRWWRGPIEDHISH